MARGKAVEVTLSDGERSELQALVRRQGTAQALAWRARIVLLAAEGRINKAIAAALGGGQHTVGKWRTRFAEARLDGLSDEPRPGAPRTIGDAKIAEVIQRTLETTPANATHWSLRSMAQAALHHPSHLAGLLAAAASGRDL